MKNFKGFALGLVLGLGLTVSGIAFAQNATTDQKEGGSCCAAMPDCCKGDSCNTKDNKDRSSQHEGCCCCGGDSCDMKLKHEKPKS